MTTAPETPKTQYDESKAGQTLREQGRRKVEEHDRKKGEFARGEKRQGDGV